MKQHRHNGHSPVDTYAEKVNYSLNNYERFKMKTRDSCKGSIVSGRLNILMENEDNQTVNSLQFCNLKTCKDENVEEWMKRVRVEAEKCEYQEQDR